MSGGNVRVVDGVVVVEDVTFDGAVKDVSNVPASTDAVDDDDDVAFLSNEAPTVVVVVACVVAVVDESGRNGLEITLSLISLRRIRW